MEPIPATIDGVAKLEGVEEGDVAGVGGGVFGGARIGHLVNDRSRLIQSQC